MLSVKAGRIWLGSVLVGGASEFETPPYSPKRFLAWSQLPHSGLDWEICETRDAAERRAMEAVRKWLASAGIDSMGEAA